MIDTKASVKKIAVSKAPFLRIPVLETAIQKREEKDGTIYLKSATILGDHPKRITERLIHWAERTPDAVFLAQRNKKGIWVELTYRQTWEAVQRVGQYLLDNEVSQERPIAILSGNSLEHGILALAAMHVGVPYAPISPAYSLKSTDYNKLRHCIDMLRPGLIFVQDEHLFEKVIRTVAAQTPVIAVEKHSSYATGFKEVVQTEVTTDVEEAYKCIAPKTIAKILFTSGSTGLPKGVINTHLNMTANWQQITQTFPFFENGGLQLIDWLPWSHTFGGNHNFGLTLYNGGTLYIDEGTPTPKGMTVSVQNLRDFAPTVYFNVPKGFEELVPYLRQDDTLRKLFFSRLKMLFYAAASMPQHVWDAFEELAVETIGKKILIASGLGMTEASPSALFNTRYGSRSGMLGMPVPGLEVKLVPDTDKLEARFKGPNLTPGYWKDKAATDKAFDEEGFFRTGDAFKFVAMEDPNGGLFFDGRLAEDFKLSSGTWVNVGILRSKLIAEGNGLIKDAVITGQDKAYLGAILFPDMEFCSKLAGYGNKADLKKISNSKLVLEALQEVLDSLGKNSTGSSTKIKRALFADFELSIDKGEITDKGSINQRSVLFHRKSSVEKIYFDSLLAGVIESRD